MDLDDHLIPEDEQPPENLQKKWDQEEIEDAVNQREMIPCPHCGKTIEKKSFSCLYCCETVFYKSGLLGRFANVAPGGTATFVFLLILITILVYHFVF